MEGKKDNCISCFDISITRDHIGTLDTNIYRQPTDSERNLNFKSEHPLEHKSAVVNALTHRANSLIRDENKKGRELKTHTKRFNFKRLSKLAIKPEIKNQVRSCISYTHNSQCCRNMRYCDTSLCSKAFRKIKIKFTKAWNSNCV